MRELVEEGSNNTLGGRVVIFVIRISTLSFFSALGSILFYFWSWPSYYYSFRLQFLALVSFTNLSMNILLNTHNYYGEFCSFSTCLFDLFITAGFI